eukprot:17417-Prorocentrum_minimum.AAC.1
MWGCGCANLWRTLTGDIWGCVGGCGDVGVVQGPTMDLTCIAMTQSFLIFGSKRGIIHYYYLGDDGRALVNEYRHPDGEIKKLFPNLLGTRCVFVDSQLQARLASLLIHECESLYKRTNLAHDLRT